MVKRVRLSSTASKHEVCTCNQLDHITEKFPDDRISQLPDEVLVSILSHLTLTEAARTCILSHRWGRLWTAFTGSLNFDGSQTLFDLNEQSLKHHGSEFVGRVNKVLSSLDATSMLDVFRVCFPLNINYSHHIDRWIEFAMEKRVAKRIEFDFQFGGPNHYTFPLECYARLKQPRGLHSISALTSLRLAYLDICGEVIQYFVSSCPLLEQLCVVYSKQLLNLEVTSAALQLKHLQISYCWDMESLEVSAPNLVSLNYFGKRIRLHVENVPKLVEVSIGRDVITYMSGSLSSYISQLEYLRLAVDIEVHNNFTQFVELNKLKHLVLRVEATLEDSLLGWTSLIEASPFLHKFTLELVTPPSRYQREMIEGPKRPHHCLKVVEIVGFVGCATDIELARYLIANATTLEKIILDRRNPLDMGQPWAMERTEKKRARKRRALLLKKHLPPGVDFVVI